MQDPCIQDYVALWCAHLLSVLQSDLVSRDTLLFSCLGSLGCCSWATIPSVWIPTFGQLISSALGFEKWMEAKGDLWYKNIKYPLLAAMTGFPYSTLRLQGTETWVTQVEATGPWAHLGTQGWQGSLPEATGPLCRTRHSGRNMEIHHFQGKIGETH